MADRSFLEWPFLEDQHRVLAAELDAWCVANLPVDHNNVDAACCDLVSRLGADGWLRHSANLDRPALDVRALCLIRETLARHDALADFAFAMQGLGMGRSACLAMNTTDSGCRERRKEPPSPALRCRNPPADPTLPIWQRPPRVTVTAGSSMARRPGSPMAA